jgi:hypothetical protein
VVAHEFYRALYAVEEKAKDLWWKERHALRLEKAVPIWEEFKTWIAETKNKVPRKSSIGDALYYFTAEYDYLAGCSPIRPREQRLVLSSTASWSRPR